MTITRLLRTRPGTLPVDSFLLDHHPAALTWKVIDLTAEQQQDVKSAPWQPLQFAQDVDVDRRHYIGESLINDAINTSDNCCAVTYNYRSLA